MRNLFVKTYVAFAALILVSFTFAGSVFLAQISRYSVQQNKSQLENSVSNIQALVEHNESAYVDTDGRSILQLYLQQMAVSSNSQMMVADAEGHVLISASGEKTAGDLKADELSDDLLKAISKKGKYFGMGTLSGLFSKDYYIAGRQCVDESGNVTAYIIAATPAEETRRLVQDIMHTFVLIVFFTLILTLIISWFLSDILTRPLKGIVSASKQFARGEFDVRVTEDNNCDEIDELAVSFNNMVSTLQQQEELSRSFVANVSHELKTPMTSISGFAEVLSTGLFKNKDDVIHFGTLIRKEALRLLQMIEEIMHLARIEDGKRQVNLERLCLRDLVQDIVEFMEPVLTEKKVTVQCTMDDTEVLADRGLFRELIMNLLDNAVKYNRPGGHVYITVRHDDHKAFFSICDTGIGIPEDKQQRVFERFYRADSSRSRKIKGTGLGLAIVKHIVEQHHGTIALSSKENEGTTITITLPM